MNKDLTETIKNIPLCVGPVGAPDSKGHRHEGGLRNSSAGPFIPGNSPNLIERNRAKTLQLFA